MPEIRLQEYTDKIKELIENDLQDEAIAHCQHILRHHPKHVETYSLLGEACLEKELFREAIEFFQRTLSADPESFVARVGLGIINDGQGALPEAIWQFERAFELAPGNSDVRRELQRLYAQRDGVETRRLKLTRGALGRLYSRNGLYERAIAEFHAVLREDADLPDIRVALAEALWREGRRLEAVEVCLDILEALPNCLKANLILGEIWVRSGHEDAGEEKLQLARELDPENVLAQELMEHESPLPAEEVYLQEFRTTPEDLGFLIAEDKEGPAVAEGGADEEQALGIVAEGDEWDTGEAIPDWMQDVGMAMQGAGADAGMESGELEEGDEVLPDWLQELMGDQVSPSDEGAPPLPVSQFPPDDREIEEGEAPDWLQAMDREEEQIAAEIEAELAPAVELPDSALEMREEAAAPEEAPVEPPALDMEARQPAVPESLRALVEAGILDESDIETALAEMSSEEIAAQRAEEVPGWLRELMGEEEFAVSPDEVQAEAAEAAVEDTVVEPPAEELPDWLRELGEPAAEAADEEDIPPWLRDLETPPAAEVEAEAETPAPADAAVEPAALELEAQEEAVPESLRALVEAGILDESDLETALAEMSSEEIAAQRAQEVPSWLRELMGEEELAVSPGEVQAEAVEAAVEEMIVEPPAEELPDWLRELGEPAAEAEDEEDIPPWLRDLETPLTAEVEAEAEVPAPAEAAVEPAAPELEAQEEAVPESLRALVEAGILDESDLETALAEMSPEEIAAQRAEEVPDWLRELMGEEVLAVSPDEVQAEAVEAAVEDTVVEPPAEELPEWLRELQVEEGVAEEPVEELSEVAEIEGPAPDMPIAEAAVEVPPIEEELPETVEIEELPEAAEIEEPAPDMPTAEAAVEVLPAEEELPEAAEIEEPAPDVPVSEAAVEVLPAEEELPEAVEIEELPEAVEIEEPPVLEEPVAAVLEPEMDLAAEVEGAPGDFQARLELARSHRDEGSWKASIDQYEHLVSAQKFLPAVLEDLRSLADQEVEQARVYQIMGDALMYQNNLDEALEMYRKARKALLTR